MAGLRWRASTALTLLAVFSLCLGLQQAPTLSAKDNAKEGNAASTAEDGSDQPSNSDDSRRANAKSSKKTTKKVVEKKKAKKGQQETDDSSDSSSATQSGHTPVAGGTSSGASGQPGGKTTSRKVNETSSRKTAPNSRAAGGTAAKPAGTGQTDAVKAAGGGRAQQPVRGQLTAKHPLVKKVIDIQNRISPDLLKQKGIVATSTGLDEDGNVVIRVQTTGADSPKIPKQAEGVAVVEVLTGPIQTYWQATSTFNQQAHQPRPVPIGTSAFNDVLLTGGCASGTLGCRLKDKHGNVFGLSNNHVFAGINGIEGGVVIGTPVVQPSPGDLNPPCQSPLPANVIGSLVKFKPYDLSLTGNNRIDAAIISTDVSLISNSTPPPPVAYGTPRSTTWIGPFLGLNVQKLGRTSGYTTGVVTGLNKIEIVGSPAGITFWSGQIEFSGTNGNASLGAPGDSGSLIVTNDLLGDRFPVALLYAGGGGITDGNPIQEVLDFFDMTIDGDDSPIIPSPGKEGRASAGSQ